MSGDVHTDLHGFVSFRLGRLALAIPVEAVREVVPLARLTHPPQLARVIHGVLNLGGDAVPVLRLDRLLGVGEEDYGLGASILIMRGEPALGLLVSHVDGVRNADAFKVMPVAPERSLNGCLSAVLTAAETEIHLLAWEKLMLEEERQRIGDFSARAQARLIELMEP